MFKRPVVIIMGTYHIHLSLVSYTWLCFLCVNNIQEIIRPLYSKKVFSLTKSNSESLQKASLTDHYSCNGPPE